MPRAPRPPRARVSRPRRLPPVDMDQPPKTHKAIVPKLPAISQDACPLFALLPAEIRNHIYALSLESDDRSDTTASRSYQRYELYFRPGYKQPRCIPTALLQTCQHIYAEASLLPPAINEHTFWFWRAPPHVKTHSPQAYFQLMSPEQRAQVHHLHFFFQQFALEDDNWADFLSGLKFGEKERATRGETRISPKKMTITLRHSDWWYWENDEPLGIDPFRRGRTHARDMGKTDRGYEPGAWGNRLQLIPTLEEVVIEFETVMRKRDQLDAILDRALKWRFPMDVSENKFLVADASSRRAYTWIGANEGDLQAFGLFPRGRPSLDDEGLRSESTDEAPADATLKPFNVKAENEADLNEDLGGLERYYVVYLTWRKQILAE